MLIPKELRLYSSPLSHQISQLTSRNLKKLLLITYPHFLFLVSCFFSPFPLSPELFIVFNHRSRNSQKTPFSPIPSPLIPEQQSKDYFHLRFTFYVLRFLVFCFSFFSVSPSSLFPSPLFCYNSLTVPIQEP
jgi:hypothetical protein